MNDWMIVSYYTFNTLYDKLARRLIASLKLHKILHHVVGVPNLKTWYKNTCYKPTFLLEMLNTFANTDIVWVDCDAEVKSYPIWFNSTDCDIAVHEFERGLYQPHFKRSPKEILSGTIYLRNNEKVHRIVYEWEKECQSNPLTWDQKSLAKVLKDDFQQLPAEYCCIDKTMRKIKHPVIVHYQASRQVRKNHGRLT